MTSLKLNPKVKYDIIFSRQYQLKLFNYLQDTNYKFNIKSRTFKKFEML